ncbi:TIGR02922 family protein [Neiella marina]|uniref:TIGR02922 family protein n=1 Tax=Neiella holothuriorum TaxID=2870530 RepID=A0ABS7EM40_9GAMM|nr:TIGR02922 family protein [Neiella holothuriorum]MBW8192938.1 TIGR02922 family protein [Neiella holothuriorum]
MKRVTVLYYTESDLRLSDEVLVLNTSSSGRVIIPAEFKQDKQIIAVLEGECRLLNRLGERVFPKHVDMVPSDAQKLDWD